MRILLADDNAIARKALAAGLIGDGYEVDLADDGEMALAQARANPPDFVISDVLMPKMDGYALCRAIREDERLHDVPVIFYSATFLEPEDEALARAVGASGFIHKDSEPAAFRRQLHDVLGATHSSISQINYSSPENREALDRQHQATLIRKLNKKVVELEQEKRALSENQQFLDHIVRTIPDVVFGLKLPGLEPSYIAPDAEQRLIGYSGDEVMGSAESWIALVHEEDRERTLQELGEIIASGRNGVIVNRMYHKDGGYRWVESRVSLKRDEKGEATEVVGSLTDITERRDAEEQLRNSQRRLQTLFQNLPGMAYRSADYRGEDMEFVSDGVKELTGYLRDELEGSRLIRYADLIHTEDQQRVSDEIHQALQEKRQFSLTYRITHRDGGIRWVWERGVGVYDDNERLYLEGFINDITLRKRAEEKLIASEQRFRNLFEMLDSGMSVHELVYDEQDRAVDYRFLDVNPAFERMTGLRADEVIGRTVREALPGIEEEWIEDYIRVAQSGEAARFIRYTETLDRYYDVVAYQTQPGQFATVFTDVSEQRRAEEVVRNIARFPEENPSPVLRINTSGDIVYSNPASRNLLECCGESEDASTCQVFVDAALKALAEGKVNKVDYSSYDRRFSFVVAPFVESGYANLYGRDVTSRVQASKQLENVNRVLRTLSKGNRSLFHATSESELLETVCEILSTDGGYPFVWAAYTESERYFQPKAWCGVNETQMQPWIDSLSTLDLHQHVMGEVVQSDKPLIVSELSRGNWPDSQRQALELAGYKVLLLLPIQYRGCHTGAIGIFSSDRDIFDEDELALLSEMASDVAYGIQALRTQTAHEKSMQRLQTNMLQTIEAVSLTLEQRDPYTAGHQHRVVELAMAIAQQLGLSNQRIEGLKLAALVHDIGKIHVPAEILNRPGRLSASEFGIIKSHPQVGYDILKGVDFDWPIADMVLQHHERLDGSGYPQGLKGDEVILEARIIGVADVVEAITSHRPYRPGLGLDSALQEIESGRDSRYDPAVVDACLLLFREKGFTWSHEFNLVTTQDAETVRPSAH